MPRTRNVTRAQWAAVNTSNSNTTRNHGCESEKENEGRMATRVTRSQSRTHGNGNRVLGAASLWIDTPSNTANASKVKGKAEAPPPKRKKLPLQDITWQFLPAPEAANRGEENEAREHGILQQTENSVNFASPLPLAQDLDDGFLGPTMSMNHPAPTYLDSPLPPSSPPSAITSPPQYPKILSKSNTSWLGLSYQEANNLWSEDDACPASQGSPNVISSNSDPFGFVALERKLKVERRATAPSLKRYHHQDESDEESGVLVADTSSPRLVRRLKRPLYQGDSTLPPAPSHPHYATPPTPHKDRKKRQRLSHEGATVLSPSSSSIPSTPSPSKPPAQTRVQDAGGDDKWDELKNRLNGHQAVEGVLRITRNRTGHGNIEPSATSKDTVALLQLGASLDHGAETEEEQADPKRPKVAKSITKMPNKLRSTRTRKLKEKTGQNVDDGEDYAEKWEQERQERTAYFKRLEGYQVEKEYVYVI